MKVTVLRPPKIDPSATTPPPGRVLRLDADADGLAIDNEARRPWAAVRFLVLFQRTAAAPLELMAILDGRRRPFDFSTARFSGAAFAEAGSDLRHAAVVFARHAPRLVLDRATFETLRGAAAQPLPADPRVYLEAVYQAIGSGQAPARPETTPPASIPAAAPPQIGDCPHCGHPRTAGTEKCDRCGVLFAKLERMAAPEPATGPTWPDDEDEPEEERPAGLGGLADLGSPHRSAPQSRWGEAFLSSDSVAAAVIGVLRGHGPRLVQLAFGALAMWLIIGTALYFAIASPVWRVLMIGLCAITAYSHTSLSLTTAIHSVVVQQDWRPRSAFGAGLGRLFFLLPSRLFSVFGMLLGFAAFIVPGFAFAMRSAFLETVAIIEGKTPQGISWGQVSSNLSDGFRFAVGGHLFATAGTSLACVVVPAFGAAAMAWLELVHPETWSLASPGLITATVIALIAAAAGLTIWATSLYVLCRELQDLQGPALWNPANGLSGWARAVLIIDPFILLLIIVRASKLDS